MTHHYPDMETRRARSLSNQVLCMIAEYHLTSLTQGLSSISLVLLEAAKDLLPPMEEYLAGGKFPGTRDVRVVEKARTLQIAIWLHRLDMAAAGYETASLSLEVAQHGRRPLVELLLAPMMSSLTFPEVVQCVLAKNQHRIEGSLDDLQGHCAQLQRELNDLTEARKGESVKSSRKRIKKKINWRQKDLKSLSIAISQHESSLKRAQDQPEETTTSEDDSSDHDAGDAEEAEMAITPVADDAPPVSAMTHPSDHPPVEEQTHSMEVDDGNDDQPLASPVSPREDELLMGGGTVGVEGEMANLKVSSPKVVTKMPPFRRHLPTSPTTYFHEALPENASKEAYKEGTRTDALEH